MSHAFTMFDPQATIHQLQDMQRALEQADIDAQRERRRQIAMKARRDETFRAHIENQRNNRTWATDHDRTRRILSARAYGPWRDTFERTMTMHRNMPLDGLRDVVSRQTESLKPVLGYTTTASFSAVLPDLDAGAITRAFKNVQCALRQLEADCTTTSKRQTMRAMLRLQHTIDTHYALANGEAVDAPYTFEYA